MVMLDGEGSYPEIVYNFGSGVQSATAARLEPRFCSAITQFAFVEIDRKNHHQTPPA